MVRNVLSKALGRHDYTFLAAETGAEALERLETHEVDTILLDLGLPDIPGIELLDRLKALAPDTEVIIFTGRASLDSAVEAIDRQVFAYLEKPVVPDLIIGTLRRAIEKRRLTIENIRLTRQLRSANRELEARIMERTRSLELEKGRIQAIMDSLAEAVVMLDEEGRLAALNAAAEAMFGVRGEALIGSQIPGDGAARGGEVDALAAAVADRRATTCKVLPERRRARRFDPTWRKEVEIGGSRRRLLEVSSTPVVDQDDTLLGRAFVARDVTAEREASSLKDEFVALVSHELRTPLSTMMIALKLLQSGKTGRLNEKQMRPLEMVSGQCEMMNEMIDRYLDISRIEANAQTADHRPIDLAPVVSDAVAQMAQLAERKSVDIECELGHGAARVSGDADQIMRVCMILLDNAIKYSARGGRVRIGTERGGVELALEVKDNGPGIPEAERSRVFEKFYRGTNRSLTEAPKGSGLGLALARLIVEKHGGRIGVQCPEGKGSKFRVSLPLLSSPAAPSAS